jgi:hypothetical protein
MKRRLVKPCLFLLFGAIVNVAVAWACALSSGGDWKVGWDTSEYQRVWLDLGGVPEAELDAHLYVERFGYEGHFTNFWRSVDEEYTDLLVFRAGWPWFGMGGIATRAWRSDRGFDRQVFGVWMSEQAWKQPVGMYGPSKTVQRSIPVTPSWPGFGINTLFYAATLWLLFAAPLALRRHFRRRRDLCPSCAYPVGTSEVCTECGKPTGTHLTF